jgi:pyridoxine 5-phosphate synthase
MEMAVVDEMIAIARDTRPEHCCLVPEKREEITPEGGLDVVRHRERIARAVQALREDGITVSAFIEPIEEQIRTAAAIGCDACELWTGGYAHAQRQADVAAAIDTLQRGVALARSVGLEVNGGHGLTYRNIGPVAAIAGFSAFHIGHSIISRSIFTGIRDAVREMTRLIDAHAPQAAGRHADPGTTT